MKRRTTLLGLAAFLLMGAVASAQAPAPEEKAGAPVPAAVAPATSTEAPSCTAKSGDFWSLTVGQAPAAKVTVTCGSCSPNSYCQGAAPNSTCWYLGGGVYHVAKCQIQDTCGDGTFYCVCTNAPPP